MPRKGAPSRARDDRPGGPSLHRARSLLHDRSVTIEMAGSPDGKTVRARRDPDPEATRKLIMPSVLDGTEVVRPLSAPRTTGLLAWWGRLRRWLRFTLRSLLGRR